MEKFIYKSDLLEEYNKKKYRTSIHCVHNQRDYRSYRTIIPSPIYNLLFKGCNKVEWKLKKEGVLIKPIKEKGIKDDAK